MYDKCCVINCTSTRKDCSFYIFPKNETGHKQWVKSIDIDRLRILSPTELRKLFICSKHFENKFFTSSLIRSRIHSCAYPTLFTPSEITSGVPENRHDIVDEIQTNTSGQTPKKSPYLNHYDHNYCSTKTDPNHLHAEMEENSVSSPSEDAMNFEAPTISRCENEPNPEQVNGVTPSGRASKPHIITLKIPCVSRSGNEPIPQNAAVDSPSTLITQTQSNNNIKCRTRTETPKTYDELLKSWRQLLKFKQRAKKLMKFNKEKAFERLTKKMHPTAKRLMWMQIKQGTKKSRGRRFSQEDKLLALSIFTQSQACYNYLHKIFIMPSRNTLKKMLAPVSGPQDGGAIEASSAPPARQESEAERVAVIPEYFGPRDYYEVFGRF